jgi:hypothetical protein
LKEEALVRTLWRTRFRRGYWLVVKQTTEWMNDIFYTMSSYGIFFIIITWAMMFFLFLLFNFIISFIYIF